jgi:regulator of protease activity HflC (stomatin/prohibitin superfamily)
VLVGLQEVVRGWGLLVTRIEVKDIAPSREILSSMELQLSAERKRTRRAHVLLRKQAPLLHPLALPFLHHDAPPSIRSLTARTSADASRPAVRAQAARWCYSPRESRPRW